MRKRIWKKILTVGTCLLAQTGILAGCTAQPAMAQASGMETGVTVSQEAVWTDLEKFQAKISVRADGLAGLVWENTSHSGEEPEENVTGNGGNGNLEEEGMDEQNGFLDQTEDFSVIESRDDNAAFESESVASVQYPTSYELVVWLSEYFQPEAAFAAPEGCLREELPVTAADGRSISITGFRWKIDPGEQGKLLEIPVTLREEYRFPKEKTVVPTCQDILHGNGALSGEENGGGIYIVKKVGNEKEILCKTNSQNLEIPAANMDFQIELSPRDETFFAGDRIYMEVSLTNNGQVPFYGISLQSEAKKMETAPVWEKEPGLEVTEGGAVLESLTPGEGRTLSFYVDTTAGQKGNLILETQARAEKPVSLERTAEQQLTVKPKKAAFTVKKTSDCENASPGDTVTYQISIHNTGEVTLHSVITTERFGLAGVTARFLEQEGVTLNKSKTQAKIPEIVPGGCVNLKARVILPENLEDQDLVNQIIVVTDETGEESAVRDQATIRVESKKKEMSGNGGGTGSEESDGGGRSASTAPKTGDNSQKEVFQALILLSFVFSAVSARRMFFRRKD
ncbi:DUF7507 domain-containing protein [Blautia sp. Sow4_E7]|uniref:DUF7507 domain-containing protein n=1 Tax=Blautia sp. Sow4_E7 TaxID=3438749 RepID=UPI003F92A78B